MAQTDAQICNVGLARIGQREFIDDLNNNSTQAQVCKQLYGPARDALLEVFAWPFATRRSTLALAAVSGVTVTRDGWAYVYALPTDCVVVQQIFPGTPNPAANMRIPYMREIADDATGAPNIPVLLTNMALASLIYTSNRVGVGLYPPLFADALSWKMASDLALSLPVKPEVGLRMEQGYERAWRIAAASQKKQQQTDVPPESIFVRGR